MTTPDRAPHFSSVVFSGTQAYRHTHRGTHRHRPNQATNRQATLSERRHARTVRMPRTSHDSLLVPSGLQRPAEPHARVRQRE